MVSYFTELIALVAINAVFFYAGLKKLFAITPTAESISSLPFFNSLPNFFSYGATLATIVIEIFAPILIILSYFIHSFGDVYQYAIYSLIGFTVLATLFYHPPTDPSQQTSFLKNVGLIGGFLLALDLHE